MSFTRPARPLVSLLGCIALAASLAGAAEATAPATQESKVIMRESFPAFHGKVAPHTFCAEDRKVSLYRKVRKGRPAKLLGRDATNRKGKWAITEASHGFVLKSGLYYAVARKSRAVSGTLCKRGVSKKVFVD